MGGPAATDDLEQGHLTQTWLATSNDQQVLRGGRVWHHQRTVSAPAAAQNTDFQNRLLAHLAEMTSFHL